MKAIQTHDAYDLRERWKTYLKAYQVYQAIDHYEDKIKADKIKAVCTLIASSYMGEKWCNEKCHEFICFDRIDKQIVNEAYTRLKNKGVLT